MRDARKDLNANIFPVNNRGEASNPGIAPCIIKEVFFPPDSPQEVATLVESALVYQNTANYEMAIKSYEDARNIWREIVNPTPVLESKNTLNVNK